MSIKSGGVSTTQDMTVNGVKVGKGGGASISNTVVGKDSFTSNTTGAANTALGYFSLQDNVDGSNNTALGYTSLQNNISGQFNTGVGDGTLLTLASGDENTALGTNAGGTTTTGSRNTCIGTGAYASSPDASDEVTIGGDNVTLTRLKGKVNIGPDRIGGSPYYEINTLAPTPTDNQTIALFSGQGISASQQTGGQYVAITRKGPIGSVSKNACGGVLFQAESVEDANCGIRGTYEYTNGRTLELFTSADNVTPPETRMKIDGDGRVDVTGSLYVNDTPVTTTFYVNEQLAIKDKLIEKLSARLDSLELKFKALK